MGGGSQGSVEEIAAIARAARDRTDLWRRLLAMQGTRSMAEVGVFKGEFAEALLGAHAPFTRYVMIDPWRHLPDWNKPANLAQEVFDDIRDEALARTAFAEDRREVLRDVTKRAAPLIEDASLDLVYVDGDHTLRGITIDLLNMFPKVRPGGLLGGDDFTRTIWQHSTRFEPTLVCPFAIHFAEAVDCPIHCLPFRQFLIVKDPAAGFALHDHAGGYTGLSLAEMAHPPAPKRAPLGQRVRRRTRRLLRQITGRG